MLSLMPMQVLELILGSAALTLFLLYTVTISRSSRRSEGQCALGCSLLIVMPLGIVGFYLLIDALMKGM